MAIPFLFVVLFCVCVVWLVAFLFISDLRVPTLPIEKYKKILVIFPHPDDEVLSCGGLLGMAAAHSIHSTLVLLTKGECGTTDAHEDLSLKEIRTNEAQVVAQLLGVSKLLVEDFGDGKLQQKKTQLRTYLRHLFDKLQPDLVITYDQSGLYGHADHIAVSEVVTELIKKYPKIDLWYNTLPQRMLQMAKLPEHMAKDPKFRSRRLQPTHKVWVGWHWLVKAKAIRAYRSQFESFSSALPLPWLPVECFCSLLQFEYFAREK